ncbi:DUF308 domain-containing protein [Limosilactobacillus kribbianus]|uniref:DUF308 domain-containing protein n=1 Tax=Limosilactobacillus kribbianus TaxID=2982695 RepID=UPI0022652F25|nr:DUF308 domain-containing protein [Limosilactobacillus kribbianus]
MIFLVIFGGLMLILGGFYLANSWQHYREWKAGTIIVVLSLAAVIYGGINLPYFHHNQQAQTEQSSTSSSQTTQTQGSNAFSDKTGTINGSANNQATQENKEMAVLRQLQKGYSKLGSVSFDEDTKTFSIKPTDDDTVKALESLVQDPSQSEQIGWPNLTKSIKSNSKQISKVLGADYSLSIVNPDNTKEALYTAKNGQTTHDVADQNN